MKLIYFLLLFLVFTNQAMAGLYDGGTRTWTLGAATDFVSTVQSGAWNITNITGTISLPTGASTFAEQALELAQLNLIQSNTAAAINDTIMSGTITAQCTDAQSNANTCPAGSTVVVNAEGAYTITGSLTGTWVGTMVAEGQFADGTWTILPSFVQSVIGLSQPIPYAVFYQLTADTKILITGGGYSNIRLRGQTYTSGTVSIAFDASLAQQTSFVAQLGTWSVNTKTNLAASAPGTATVGATSVQIVAANTSRKGLHIHNNSINIVYLAFGATAVVGSGEVLYPGGIKNMDEYDFYNGAVNAIASAAGSVVSIQEYQ